MFSERRNQHLTLIFSDFVILPFTCLLGSEICENRCSGKEQNQYYVDKTMYLPLLEEQPDNLLFVRPAVSARTSF